MSKISICNLALASLGAAPIRSFDEDNKRARMCDVFFDSTRDYLLSKFDWPFARKLIELTPLADTIAPEGMYAYGMPSDCKTPRDLEPPGSRQPWEVMGRVFYCNIPPEASEIVVLRYTVVVADETLFSDTFSNLLSLAIAVRMAPAITQDKSLTTALYEQFKQEQRDVWESDANIGENYRAYDEDPNNDTFVYPDGFTPPENYRRGPYGDS